MARTPSAPVSVVTVALSGQTIVVFVGGPVQANRIRANLLRSRRAFKDLIVPVVPNPSAQETYCGDRRSRVQIHNVMTSRFLAPQVEEKANA